MPYFVMIQCNVISNNVKIATLHSEYPIFINGLSLRRWMLFFFQYSSNKGGTGFYFAMYLYPVQVRKTGLSPPLSPAKIVQWKTGTGDPLMQSISHQPQSLSDSNKDISCCFTCVLAQEKKPGTEASYCYERFTMDVTHLVCWNDIAPSGEALHEEEDGYERLEHVLP